MTLMLYYILEKYIINILYIKISYTKLEGKKLNINNLIKFK